MPVSAPSSTSCPVVHPFYRDDPNAADEQDPLEPGGATGNGGGGGAFTCSLKDRLPALHPSIALQLAQSAIDRIKDAVQTSVRDSDAAKEQLGQSIDSTEKFLENKVDDGRAWLRQHGGPIGQNISDQIGLLEGGNLSVYDAGKGLVQLADGANSLANPLEWAANPQANIARIKSAASSVKTLGELANPFGWLLHPQETARLTGALWHSAATSFEKDPAKFTGNVAGTVAMTVVPVGGEVAAVADAARVLKLLNEASDIAKTVENASRIRLLINAGADAGKAEALADAGTIAKAGQTADAAIVGAKGGMADVPSGSFSISDWSTYPAGVPRPQGPLRIVEGAEYDAARAAADKANAAIRKEQGLVGQPVDVHEIQPVKFGGSPTDSANKVNLPRDVHRQQVTPWWNQLQKDIGH